MFHHVEDLKPEDRIFAGQEVLDSLAMLLQLGAEVVQFNDIFKKLRDLEFRPRCLILDTATVVFPTVEEMELAKSIVHALKKFAPPVPSVKSDSIFCRPSPLDQIELLHLRSKGQDNQPIILPYPVNSLTIDSFVVALGGEVVADNNSFPAEKSRILEVSDESDLSQSITHFYAFSSITELGFAENGLRLIQQSDSVAGNRTMSEDDLRPLPWTVKEKWATKVHVKSE